MSYIGQSITIPFGDFGILTDLAPSDIPANAFIDANNITLEKGYPEKAPGTRKYNAGALTSGVVSVFDYWPNTVQQRLIAATSDGKLWRDIGDRTFTATVPINTGLGVLTPNTMFVEGGREVSLRVKKLFFFPGMHKQIQVLSDDGTSFADIAQPSIDWTDGNFPVAGVTHRNRLWVFQGQTAYASDTGDHENFVSNFLALEVFPGEGGDIKAGFVYKGRLFSFKDEGFVYFLDDSELLETNWVWKKLASNFGLSGPNAIIEALDDMLAGNTTGTVTSYKATQAFGDIESADVFRSAQMENYVRENLSKAGLTEQHAVYHAEKKQVFFTYRTTYKPTNDALICIDMNKNRARITVLPKGTPQCLGLRKDSNRILRPIYGDSLGFVHLMDQENRLEGGVAYEGSFQTPHIDFRFASSDLAHKQKHFDFLAIEFLAAGNHNVSVDVFIDEKFVETLSFEQQLNGVFLDTFLLDTDRLVGNATQTLTKRLRGTGRRISFKFSNSGSNQSFQIASITVGLRPSGEQATKF